MEKSLPSSSAVASSLLGLVIVLAPASAHALRTGQNFACVNCHEGQDKPEVVATLSATRVEPGESLTITVTTTHPTALVGGVLVDSKGAGAFEIVNPTETHLFDDDPTFATHSVPKPYTNGQVEFTFSWVAPETIGPMEFEIWANAANDNLEPHDDSAAGITANFGVGCDALWYYLDADGDSLGEDVTGVYSCDPMPERINQGGDCDDQNPSVNSAVTEVCNDIDDNCDGEIDEGFEKQLWVSDMDGDGFGSPSGESRISCAAPPGFAPSFDDCDDAATGVNPGAVEVVNGIDDNCNGMTDETAIASDGAGGTALVGAGGAAAAPVGTGGTSAAPGEVPVMPGDGAASTSGGAPAALGGATSMSGVGAPAPALTPANNTSSGCALRSGPWSPPTGMALLVGLGWLARRRSTT